MNNCEKCGAALPAGAATCPTCGSAVPARPVQPAGQAPGDPKRKKKKRLKTVLVVVLCLFVLVGLSRCVGCGSQEKDREPWPQSPLAQMLPTLDAQCDSVFESDGHIAISVSDKMDRAAYDAYVSACEGKGFAEDQKEATASYEAYNADGYKLELSFSDGKTPTMRISLDAPKANGDLVWPSSGVATLIPNPEKEKGSVAVDSSSQFTAYVGEMSSEEYGAYVEKCIDAGFGIDYSKGDTYFNAKNDNGDSLSLKYEGFDIMYVSVNAAKSSKGSGASDAEEQEEPAASEPEPEPDAASDSAGGIDPAFKEAMDEYESFMDGYVDFMAKYLDSDDVLSMAVDYAKWVADYADMAEKFEAVDDGSLNDAELAYYLEVSSRVNAKLATVATA